MRGYLAIILALVANVAFAQGANEKTAKAVIASAETCKSICVKAKDTALNEGNEKLLYQECFKKRLCEAGRLIFPMAKENPPAGLWERSIGAK